MRNAYQMVLFLKKVFSALIIRFFWQKIQKILNVGKIRKYDEERVFFSRKKRFRLLKLHLYQIRKAQNILVVAGSLVCTYPWYARIVPDDDLVTDSKTYIKSFFESCFSSFFPLPSLRFLN